jgi:uncharacterized protein YukE
VTIAASGFSVVVGDLVAAAGQIQSTGDSLSGPTSQIIQAFTSVEEAMQDAQLAGIISDLQAEWRTAFNLLAEVVSQVSNSTLRVADAYSGTDTNIGAVASQDMQ